MGPDLRRADVENVVRFTAEFADDPSFAQSRRANRFRFSRTVSFQQRTKFLRDNSRFSMPIKAVTPVQDLRAKIFPFHFSEKHVSLSPFRAGVRAYRDRHETWGGMRWTRMGLLTSGLDADGEVAWSWRPKGSASSWRRCIRIAAATVAIGKVHRGERL
jgi:hypothetical protein